MNKGFGTMSFSLSCFELNALMANLFLIVITWFPMFVVTLYPGVSVGIFSSISLSVELNILLSERKH